MHTPQDERRRMAFAAAGPKRHSDGYLDAFKYQLEIPGVPGRLSGVSESEKYLFYRGVGTWTRP